MAVGVVFSLPPSLSLGLSHLHLSYHLFDLICHISLHMLIIHRAPLKIFHHWTKATLGSFRLVREYATNFLTLCFCPPFIIVPDVSFLSPRLLLPLYFIPIFPPSSSCCAPSYHKQPSLPSRLDGCAHTRLFMTHSPPQTNVSIGKCTGSAVYRICM